MTGPIHPPSKSLTLPYINVTLTINLRVSFAQNIKKKPSDDNGNQPIVSYRAFRVESNV